jgi:eukaryotic-like serine/threonine-protein kinase
MPSFEPELQPGVQVGVFLLTRPVQAQAPITVWHAEMAPPLRPSGRDGVRPHGTPAIVKFSPAPDPDDPEGRTLLRFEREARLLQTLRHPGIVQVIATGVHGLRRWLALEAIDGPDLSTFVAPARRLPAGDVARLLAEVAEALDHAHRAGVLHRDIKPANIVLDRAGVAAAGVDVRGGIGRARLIDFGIAADTAADRTVTGVLPGSPAYMSPEQLAGAEPDVAGDLFALGVTGYELLAGIRPWQADSLGALLRSLARDPPVPLAERRPGLPTGLVAAVHQCLERDPARRPAGAAALARALRGFGPTP